MLSEVTSIELTEYVEALDEALDVADVGKCRAAQALAGSVLDPMLRHTIKPERISGYCKRRQGDGEPRGSGPNAT